MKFCLALALVGLAGCGQTPQPRDAQAETLAREQAELHTLLDRVGVQHPASAPAPAKHR